MGLTPDEIAEVSQNHGWPRFRATQILRWIHQRRAQTIDQMTDIALADRATLNTELSFQRLEASEVLTAQDGTKKFIFRLADGLTVESVVIPDEDRLTLCLSTQVGCTLDCNFCLTATMGLKRNLKGGEIVDQVLSVLDQLGPEERLSNYVFMGMGEPLANLDAVTDAITRMTDQTWGLGISPSRITLSTAGWATRLQAVAALGINLAISLNATTDAQRERLMPAINRLFPLEALLAACREYPLPPRRRLTFEYVLIAEVNDRPEDAIRLVRLLKGIRAKINLIPFNEFPGNDYKRPRDTAILRFQGVLRKAGLDTFIRKSKGRDVLGACGQLGNLPDTPALITVTPRKGR
jgi:23S rRNA (adenine2503-C2)-methyltransferase